jgi:hypothetical protein
VTAPIAAMSIINERRKSLPVIDAANAQKLFHSVGREILSDSQLDMIATTAMDIMYRETYYETFKVGAAVVGTESDGIIHFTQMTNGRPVAAIRPVQSH